jgi:preprotein translocase subunit SecG
MQAIKETTDIMKKTTAVGAVSFIVYCIMSKYFIISDREQENQGADEDQKHKYVAASKFFTRYL